MELFVASIRRIALWSDEAGEIIAISSLVWALNMDNSWLDRSDNNGVI